jgi:hypothetical protein
MADFKGDLTGVNLFCIIVYTFAHFKNRAAQIARGIGN